MKKYLLNLDIITLIIGGLLLYFSEPIVTFFYPLDNVPSSVLALLLYFTIFSIALFGVFGGIAYLYIRVFWRSIYYYFEAQFKTQFDELTPIQKICVSLSLFCFSLFMAVRLFQASISAL